MPNWTCSILFPIVEFSGEVPNVANNDWRVLLLRLAVPLGAEPEPVVVVWMPPFEARRIIAFDGR